MNFEHRFKPSEQAAAQAQQSQQQQSQPQVREFNSVEELLQQDAQQTTVPPAVGQRLKDSLAQEPAPRPRSWWRRLFGR